MVILHVTAPAEFGGLERVVQALASGHRARGHRVHVAAVLAGYRGEPALHPFLVPLAEAGVEVHPVTVGGREYLRERAAVSELCRRIGAEVVHTHGYRADVVDGGAARARGIPTVATVHGFTGGGVRNRIYERLQTASYRGFDGVVAVSRPLADRLRRAGVPARRLRVIPNAWSGAGTAMDPSGARAVLGAAPGEFHVGWVGRLSREKGADVLLDALPRLAGLPLRVAFVGDGPERGALERRAARLGVAERVRWHGALPGAGRLMPGFDAFVLSSRTEGTPIVLFEAMAAGVPVVATAVGGVPDVVGEAEAHLVPAEDPAALAAALRRLHGGAEEARTRAAAARHRLAARFGPDPWLDEYEELYHHLQSPSPVAA